MVVTFSDCLSTGLSAVEVCSGCPVASVGAFTGVSSAMMAGSSLELRRIQRLRGRWVGGERWEVVGEGEQMWRREESRRSDRGKDALGRRTGNNPK